MSNVRKGIEAMTKTTRSAGVRTSKGGWVRRRFVEIYQPVSAK